MNENHDLKIFIKWAAPAALFLTPLLLIIVVIKVFREQGSGVPVDLFNPDLLLILAFCIVGFLIAAYYCKKELGWFGGDDK